jgi:hypothetical protein
MKALFFTLLLLFIAISPSIATRSRYLGRQRIFYTFFTPDRVVNIELLFSPQTHRIVSNYFTHTEIGPPNLGVQQIVIRQRSARMWVFNINPLVSLPATISAEIPFRRPEGVRRGVSLPPGVSVIDPRTVTLAQLTENPDPNVLNARPLEVTFVLMSVLEPDATGLDSRTQQRIRELGMRRFLEPPVGPAPIPPLELDAGIWIHLLAGLMLQYRPDEIECEPAPKPIEPRHNPDEACRPPVAGKRGPGDQDDPSGQPGPKLSCTGWDGRPFPDLNDEPAGQGGAGQVAGSSRQHHYNPQQPKATYEVPKLIPYTPPPPKVIYDRVDAHVELQAGGFFFPDWLMDFFREEVKVPPKKHQWMSCFEVSMGHRGELRK